MTRLHAWLWRWIPGCHPDMAALLAWADRSRPEAGPHLAGCGRCRETALRLRAAISFGAGNSSADAAPRRVALNEVYADLQVRMQAWSSLSGSMIQRRAGRARAKTASRRYSALEVYFGKETAERIEQSVRRNTSDVHLIPAVEPLFNAFLGRRAAEALSRKIVGSTV